jgi:hypothetical protein
MQRIETEGVSKREDIGINPKEDSHPGLILLKLSDQIRTRVCIVPRRLLVHAVIDYGVPICAFYGNVTPRRSRHKPYLECSGTFAGSLVSSDSNQA